MPELADQSYGQMDIAYAERSGALPEDQDGPVWMVNLMAYKKKAVYDGVESDIDGKEADNRYNPIDVLMKIGASFAYVGDVIGQNPDQSPTWDRIAVVKYLSRRSFVEMGARKDFREKHVHKQAGMAQTIVCACLPIPGALDAAPPPADASEDAGKVTSLHMLQFKDDAKDSAAAYLRGMTEAAAIHGGRADAILDSESTFLGDGRSWDHVLMITYPSQHAHAAATADQADLDTAAVNDRYDLLIRPMIDNMRGSQV